MSTQTIPYREIFDRLPAGSTLTLRNVSWEEYEGLLEGLGEASGLRLSYDEGTLSVVTLSPEHESYSRLIERLVDRLSARLRIRVLFFGSSTMKRRDRRKGTEPDACFYVQSAAAIGSKIHLDFASDPPPDIVVEIDVSHDSLAKFSSYAELGVPEIWRYDGKALTIYSLEEDEYRSVESSLALPMLTAGILTGFTNQRRQKDQYDVLLAFDEWLDDLNR
ncbi:MAG TPA: Uma2 family endonuclease [Vicinamibacteria bacterium]|nr:Uma2 family endonuclease [Vicinamibacteria bacterium]